MTARPTDEELKEIYALFKQATVGDVNVGKCLLLLYYFLFTGHFIFIKLFKYVCFHNLARPGMLDFKGKAKWDSWESKKGMSSDAAKEAYVVKAEELVAKYSA